MKKEGMENGTRCISGAGNKKLRWRYLLLGAVMSAVFLTGCGAQKKNATDYITASFTGLDSEGTMTLSFDREKLKEEITEKKQLTEREKETLDSLLSGIEKDFIISEKEGLSNGDEVKITGGLEKNLLKDYGVAFDNTSVSVKVEGLAESIEISLNDYLKTEASGFDGNGNYSIWLDRDSLYEAVKQQAAAAGAGQDPELWEKMEDCIRTFSMSPSYFEGLSTGDTVHSELSIGNAQIGEYGITFTTSDFEEKVSGFTPVETIGLSDYLTLSLRGFEGFATAEASLDTEKLAADLEEMLKKDGRGAYRMADEETDYASEAQEMASAIVSEWKRAFYTELDSVENTLSNGVPVSIDSVLRDGYGNDAGEYFAAGTGAILQEGSGTETVEGLPASAALDISSYLSLEFSGYEGNGTAAVIYDDEGFQGALDSLICSQDPSLSAEDFSYRGAYNLLHGAQTDVDSLSGLTNGEEVSVEVTSQTESIPEYGIILEASPVKAEVSGLTPTRDLDLSKALNVTFSGICPFLTANFEVDRDLPGYYQSSLSEMYGGEPFHAENGDVYEGKITYDAQALLDQGYVVTGDTYSFTVSGLDTWTLGIENAEDEKLKDYLSEAETLAQQEFDRRSQDIANSLTEGRGWAVWEDVEFSTDKVWYAVTPEDSWNGNEICFTGRFLVPVRGYDRNIAEKTVGYAAWIRNVTMDPSGKLHSDHGMQIRLFFAGEDAEEEMRNGLYYELGENAEINVMETAPEAGEEPAEETAETGTEPEEDPEHPEWISVNNYIEPVYADAAVAAQASGDPVVLDGHTYYHFSQIDGNVLTWHQAKQFCEAAGGHLAVIRSWREQCAINRLLQEGECNTYWIGASDDGFEGSWKWVTGEPFDFEYWRDDQPDNYTGGDEGAENYLSLYMDYSGRWNDLPDVTDGMGFILEMEPAGGSEEETSGKASDEDMVYLSELIPSLSTNQAVWDSVRDPYGNLYFRTIAYDTGSRAVSEYDLKGEYDTFSFTLSTSEDTDSEASMEMLVWGDEKLLFASYGYARTDAPVSAEISVSGVRRLSVQTVSRNSSGMLFLNDARLHRAELSKEEAAAGEKYYLADLAVLNSYEAEIMTGRGVPSDVNGRLLRDTVILNTGSQGEITFRIPVTEGSFIADLSMNTVPNGDGVSAKVEILGDDSVLEKVTINAYDGMIPAELDVTGVEIMTVKVSNAGETGANQQVLLSDICVQGIPEETGSVSTGLPQPEFPEISPEYEEVAAAVLTCGNYRYYRFDRALSISQARNICRSAGGTLAMPKTGEQNAAVRRLLQKGLWNNYDSYWLGASDEIFEGMWVWDDETKMSDTGFQNWSSGQPDNYQEIENSLCMYSDGTWNDDDGSTLRGFVMQVKAAGAIIPETGEKLSSFEAPDMAAAEFREYMDGERFMPGSLYMNAGERGYASFELSGKYRALSGGIVASFESDVNSRADFAVFGDGVLLYRQKGVRTGTDLQQFMIDVSGVRTLTVMSSGNGNISLFLTEPVLFPAGEAVPSSVSRLSALTVVDSTGVSGQNTMLTDVYGGLHDSAVILDSTQESYILYNLEKKYTSLDLSLVCGGDSYNWSARKVTVILDGETAYESELSGYFRGEKITLDLTGRSTLRIEAAPLSEGGDYLYLVDDILK